MQGGESSESGVSHEGSSGVAANNAAPAPPPPPPLPSQVIQPVPGPRFIGVQYPGAAMMMQPRMIPAPYFAPNYMPYHQHHIYQHHPPPPQRLQQGGSSSGGGSNVENRTIWVGDLHNWMDEDYLRSCFASTGEVSSIKVIRNKQTGFPEGYGFVEFLSHAAAEKVLQTYASSLMPNTEQPFHLNWATFSMWDKRTNNGSDLSIFVGDLAADVTDTLLHETFASKYPSVKAAKVVIDPNSGRSKGYGFVRFGDDAEKTQAMTEMNGVYCSGRAMRIGAATPRRSSAQFSPHGGYSNGGSSHGSYNDGDVVNTTIFVGGLDPSVTDEDLRQPFSQYGEIVSVKIPAGKGCGFVLFANRSDAEEALQNLNGTTIGKQTVRLSWGRNPANKQSRGGDHGNQWTAAYYPGPYGYALPPHDPGMYAAAYGAYPMYGTHQQQVNFAVFGLNVSTISSRCDACLYHGYHMSNKSSPQGLRTNYTDSVRSRAFTSLWEPNEDITTIYVPLDQQADQIEIRGQERRIEINP